jgi:hypothetical protein
MLPMNDFIMRVWLDEPDFCGECPGLDNISEEQPKCKPGGFWLRNENIGKHSPNWVVRRPRGCPLMPIEKLCEIAEKMK